MKKELSSNYEPLTRVHLPAFLSRAQLLLQSHAAYLSSRSVDSQSSFINVLSRQYQQLKLLTDQESSFFTLATPEQLLEAANLLAQIKPLLGKNLSHDRFQLLKKHKDNLLVLIDQVITSKVAPRLPYKD